MILTMQIETVFKCVANIDKSINQRDQYKNPFPVYDKKYATSSH